MTVDLPEGWVIDPLALGRLEHQLALAPPATGGIVAPLTPLPPGASYRSLAEHLALLPLAARHRAPAGAPPPVGALLRAPGHGRGDTSGTDGPWLIDEGTASHDPSAVARELLVAHPLGCSPFPRRPIVVLLGLDAPDEVLGWARETANSLLGEEIEARLALTRFPEGRHLTRPCLADPRSLVTLRPNVVITLDPAAAEVADDWCRPWRATSIVDLDDEAGAPIVRHPALVGGPAGRHRASARPDVAPDTLATLVRRLAAGPQPGSPTSDEGLGAGSPAPAPRVRTARLRPAARRSVTMATGLLDTRATAHVDGLATALRRLGDAVQVLEPVPQPEALEASDLLILHGLVSDPTLLEITARRRERGRPTVVDLGRDDLGPPGDDERSFGLAADVAALVAACGLVTSPSEAWCAELRASGLTAHRLPTPHRPPDPDSPGAAREQGVRNGAPQIGWILDPNAPDLAPDASATIRAVAQALASALTAGAARLMVGGDPRGWPEDLVALPGVTTRPGDPEPDDVAGLALLVWTPAARSVEAAGAPRWVVDAGLRHVPLLAPSEGTGEARVLLAPEYEVHRADRPEAWSLAIDLLLGDEPVRRAATRDAHRRAEAATAPARAEQVAADLVTWAFAHTSRGTPTSGAAIVTAPVLVVVPAHVTGATNLADLERCLGSVLRHAADGSVAFDLLVIDDASPHGDVASLVDALEPPAGVAVSFLHHPENRGFVATANEGLHSSDGDVVILNSDTVVTAGWLDRLAAAAGDAGVATVTPLTNAGSICTLPPHLCAPFDLDGDEPRIDACAELVARHSLVLRPEVISGVGFCMYVSRAALDAVGAFDEEAFGRGYGEEVDFCLRASAAGFRHLVEDSTFVFHRGAGSFGDSREAAMAQASTLLRQRYPGFKVRNRRERANDPLAPVFANLQAALAPRDPARPHVLHVVHAPSLYGGTERHLAVIIDTLRDEVDASILHPSPEGFVLHSEWRDTNGRDQVETRLLPGPAPDMPTGSTPEPMPPSERDTGPSALRVARDLFDLTAVHVHNLIGHPLDTLAELDDFPGPVVCSVHDLYLACPNHSLLYKGAVSCGIPDDLDVCDACLRETRGLGRDDLEAHRETVRAGLGAVDTWITFSQAAADHVLRAHPIPEERLRILPHGSLVPVSHAPLDETRVLHAPLQVAFAGRGWAKKGLDVVNRAAEELAGHPGVHLHHFGDLRDRLSDHITGHGSYDSGDLPALLHEAGIGIVLLPGPYAETYGFVMSEALHAGLPVIGPYYGAIGERIRDHDAGWTIDPDDPDSLPTLLLNLERCRIEVLRATRRARSVHLDEVARSALGYRDLYRPGATPPGTRRAEDETPE